MTPPRRLQESWVTEHLRQSPWLTQQGAERCAHAVAQAIRRFHARLAAAVDAEDRPDEVLRAFALHLHEYLLVPSGRGGSYAREQAEAPPGCFIYVPPRGWCGKSRVLSLKSKVQRPKSKVSCPRSKLRSSAFKVRGSRFEVRCSASFRPAGGGGLPG